MKYLSKYFITFVLFLVISGCQPILKLAYNIHSTSFYSNRESTVEINKKNLSQFDINYVMLYRTNEYIEYTGDTINYSGEISFYNEYGKEYINSEYCYKVNYKGIDSKSILSNSYNVDTSLNIQNRLIGLEYLSGKSYQYRYNKNYKYYVVMDWNTFWLGPEKKRLKKVVKSFPKDSTKILFINKDYILEDSLSINSVYFK